MRNYNKAEKAVIWLDSFVGLEYKIKSKILFSISKPDEIIENLPKFRNLIIKIAGENVYNNMKSALNENYINNILKSLDDKQIEVVTVFSDKYPIELCEIQARPIILYCKGNTDLLLSKNKFSIVGSRKTIPIALKAAEEIAEKLSENNFTIVSGLAEGGDTAAIKGAIKNKKIISVLAYGFNYIYPEYNRKLLTEIINCGLVITEHTPETAPLAYLFPVRNRIIAGLSKGTLIVSGNLKSGTAYTANYAVDYNRDLFAFPYNLNVNSGSICNSFIKKGAYLTDSVLDIAQYYGLNFEENKQKVSLSENEMLCLNIIKQKDIHLNELIKISQLKIYQIMPLLSSLEIKGLIIKSGSNIYSAT